MKKPVRDIWEKRIVGIVFLFLLVVLLIFMLNKFFF